MKILKYFLAFLAIVMALSIRSQAKPLSIGEWKNDRDRDHLGSFNVTNDDTKEPEEECTTQDGIINSDGEDDEYEDDENGDDDN
ncbi:unnamed protein product [Gordionus sp. m RMFG-2023]